MNRVVLANLFARKEWEEWKRERERDRRRRLIERLSRWARIEGMSDEEDEETDDMDVSEDEDENGAVEEEMEMKGGKNGGSEVRRVRRTEKEDEEEEMDVVEVDERVDVEEEQEESEVDERDGEGEVAPDMNCEEEEGIEVETEVIREVDTEEEKEVMEAEEVEEEEKEVEEAEEGENEFESDDKEEGGVVEEEEEGDEEEEEGDEEEEEHPEEAEHFRGQRRRSQDATFEQSQESTSRDDRRVMEEVNLADSVESDNEDSTGFEEEFYNFERMNHGEEAVGKRYEHPEELEENSIQGALASTERKEEKDESEMLRDEEKPAEDSWTIEDEKEETTDDEEADEADEDADNNDKDVTKIYCKDDHFQVVFGTLIEFRDASLLTDLTLSTHLGKSIHVHSTVLAAVSCLIRESLSRSNVESNRSDERKDRDHRWLVSLGPEVDQVGLEAVVEFAYTGLMSRLNKNTVHQIKVAAQTLGAPRVLDLCTEEDEETSTKPEGQEKEERLSAAEQMTISLQSIKQLWVDKVGCDVILEALGGSLHVHRAILAAGSDYFRSMFTLGMKESHQSCVDLPFLLASELEVLIGCTYSGALSLSWGCVFEITSTALQLQYQPALSLCLNFLQQEINPHSCLDVVSFAEAYEMVQLLEAAEDFVLRQFQKVACTSKFKDLPLKQLLKYLNSHSLCVPSELVVFKAVVAWIQARPRIRIKLAKELMKTIHFPLMTFKEFKEVKSLNMWSNHTLTALYERIYKDFFLDETAPQNQYRTYLPKESLILIGGDYTSDDLSSRNISRELWFGNSLRNHMGIRKAMEWRKLGEMPEPGRYSHEVAVLKGQLYIFGGKKYYGTNDTLSSVYRYDLLQNSWESLADMHEKRCSFSAVVLDGKIYAIGGQCGPDYKESVEQYCPITNSWGFNWPLDLPLGAHVAKVLQGQIFVSGGLSNNQCLASMFRYHPETGSTYLANMAKPRAHHCMETLGECLYVAGGVTMDDNMNVSDQLACEVYNPVADSWTAFTSLPVPHVGAGSSVLEGKFYVLGGYSQEDYSDTKKVHRYDPTTRSWENMGLMPGPNNDIRASVLCLPSHFRL